MSVKKKKYANNLRKYRNEAGLTQDQFAALCKWKNAQGRIANYEAGVREPSLSDVRIMVGVLITQGVMVTIDDVFPTERAIKV